MCCRDHHSALGPAECCGLSEGEPCLWDIQTTANSWASVGFGEVWSSAMEVWALAMDTGTKWQNPDPWGQVQVAIDQVGLVEKLALVVACYCGLEMLPFSLSLSLF